METSTVTSFITTQQQYLLFVRWTLPKILLQKVKAILSMRLYSINPALEWREAIQPKYPESLWHLLPMDMVHLLLQYVVQAEYDEAYKQLVGDMKEKDKAMAKVIFL